MVRTHPLLPVAILILACSWNFALAQPPNDDCLDAQELCPNIDVAGTTEDATVELGGADGDGLVSGTWGQCYDVHNSVWFTFLTNSSGGDGRVIVSNITCITGDSLQATVFSATNACDPTSFSPVACDMGAASGLDMQLSSLQADTRYWVHVDGVKSAVPLSECSFDIKVTGVAVEWQLNATVIDANCNQADGSISGSASPNTASLTYTWSNGQSGTSITGLAAGTYTVTITDPSRNCDTVAQVVVSEVSGITDITLTSTDAQCGNTDGTIVVSDVVGGTAPFQYSLDSAIFQPGTTFSSLGAGIYTVFVVDTNGCSYSEQTTINQNSDVVAQVASTDATCGMANGVVEATSTQGGTAPYSYALNGGASQTDPQFANLSAGTYTLIVTDDNGCMDTLQATVNQQEPPEAVASAELIECGQTTGTITVQEPTNGLSPFMYQVDGVTQSNGTFENQDPGTYDVVVTDNSGCSSTSEVVLAYTCLPVKITTGFSPNGDGFNDEWEITNLNTYPNSKVLVYNRWGNRVFKSEGYDEPWDGKNAGVFVPDATYYWVIYLDENDGSDPQTGSVTIVK